jgi:hypothetical protein
MERERNIVQPAHMLEQVASTERPVRTSGLLAEVDNEKRGLEYNMDELAIHDMELELSAGTFLAEDIQPCSILGWSRYRWLECRAHLSRSS